MSPTTKRKKLTRQPKPKNLTGISPYYDSDEITLYQGDCLKLLPELKAESVHTVIADPPYCSGGMTTASRTQNPEKKYCHSGKTLGRPSFSGDNRDQRSFEFWCTMWMIELLRVTKPAGYFLCFTDWRMLPSTSVAIQAAGWTWRGVIAWNKGRGARAPHKGYFRHQCEYIVWATKGSCKKRTDAGPFDGCHNHSVKQSDKWHMTGKPTELLKELVKAAPKNGTILDPFAGSSTSGVAALLTGRKFIGCELSKEYCAISRKRLKAAEKGELLNVKR